MPTRNSVMIVAGSSWTKPFPSEIRDYAQLWGINNVWKAYDLKPDMIVAMDDLRRDEKAHPNYVDDIMNAGCPVIGPERIEKWPQIEAYPVKEAVKYLAMPHAWRVLDNSINYAFVLAMMQGFDRIAFRGTDFVKPYDPCLLECSFIRWAHKKYVEPPYWFEYYDDFVVYSRAPTEPGQESFHFLLGMAHAKGIRIDLADTTTILNSDRVKFFYGYEDQPDA